MLEYLKGDIFESPAQVIVNTVNTVGVMGKGIALAYKERYPDMFEAYKKTCEKHLLSTGKLMLWNAPDHMILLFPTKENWRNPSKLSYIEDGLQKFTNTYADKNITSIAFPRLGCGNGELNWDDVRPIMESYLKPLPIDVYIYLGDNNVSIPEHKEPTKTLAWLKENAKDMSFDSIVDDICYTSSIFPYTFSHEGQTYSVKYKEGIEFFQNSTLVVKVDENAFFDIWDDIRNKGIFSEEKTIGTTLVYALLASLRYLSPIKFVDASGNMVAGYQVNEGVGRVYATLGVMP